MDEKTCFPVIAHQPTQRRVIELDVGDQVRIRDAAGAIVATATLELTVTSSGACSWEFVTEVPRGGRFYTAEVESFETPAQSEEDARNGLF